jgi:2-keto-3-deoxy-galactonokinase
MNAAGGSIRSRFRRCCDDLHFFEAMLPVTVVAGATSTRLRRLTQLSMGRHTIRWFRRSAEDGLANPRLTGRPLRQVFGVRPLALVDDAPKESLAAYLSGLSAGAEVVLRLTARPI